MKNCSKPYNYCSILLMLMLCFNLKPAHAQQFFTLDDDAKRVNIPFTIVRDMIIVRVNINGKGPFNFILDTGVGLMIITEPKLIDSLNIKNKRLIKITGLGNGEDFEACVTSGLKFTMPGITGANISAAIYTKDHFGLSNYAGIPIHGLLGYEFFNSFAVKVNFEDSTLTVGAPNAIRAFRKSYQIPLNIEEHKPYITDKLTLPNGKPMDAKLIVDLGAGHAVSLENLLEKNNGLPDSFIPANLGLGINGPIRGYLSRISEIQLGKYKLTNVITSFPANVSEKKEEFQIQRDGNLGIDILKRFNLIIDYPNGTLCLKPNLHFKDPFEHDMSGLEYYTEGDDLKHIIVSSVERGSAGDDAGLSKGDEIMAINFKPVEKMSIDDIDNIFRSREDRSLLLEVLHDNVYGKVVLKLKKRI